MPGTRSSQGILDGRIISGERNLPARSAKTNGPDRQMVGSDFVTAWADNRPSGEIENQDPVVAEGGLGGQGPGTGSWADVAGASTGRRATLGAARQNSPRMMPKKTSPRKKKLHRNVCLAVTQCKTQRWIHFRIHRRKNFTWWRYTLRC